jgi:hypothetical protein
MGSWPTMLAADTITFGQSTKLAAALCIGRWWLTTVLVTPRLRAHEGDNDLL